MDRLDELAASIAALVEETKALKYETAYVRELVHEMAKDIKKTEVEPEPEPEPEPTKWDKYNSYFNLIKKLCIEASKKGIVTTFTYFTDNGVPEDFIENCKKAKLVGGGRNGQNVFWNWNTNKMFPGCTIEKFMEGVRGENE